MDYATIARIRKLRQAEAAHEISDAARLANELQAEYPGTTRTEALREAERIQRKLGTGWSLSPASAAAQSLPPQPAAPT